jgi:SAM-dependent methyltransferase
LAINPSINPSLNASANASLKYDNLRLDTQHLWPSSIGNVLEIGCGPARLSEVLDCESYWGVEPDALAVGSVRASVKPNIQILNADYASALSRLPTDFFDLVICHDSIEHLPDHDQFFLTLPQLCRSGARLVLTIPNMRHLLLLVNLVFRKDWPYSEVGLMDRTHLRWFTEKSLRKVLAKYGYEIEAFERMQPTFFTNNPIKIALANAMTLVLGQDSRYVYFAARVIVPSGRK